MSDTTPEDRPAPRDPHPDAPEPESRPETASAAASGPYRKVRALGSGSVATVWEGVDDSLDRRVAIKELSERWTDVPGFAERFLAEAQQMARVAHPHVLTIHTVDRSHALPWIIMELADGGSLEELARAGPVQPEQVERILRQSLAGLAAIHHRGIVHRDIKPGNLFLCGQRYKVGDFGVSFADRGRDGKAAGGPDTMMFAVPRYVAPEELGADGEPSPASDLYSLGLVLYELALGRDRFEALVREVAGDAEGGDAEPWFELHLGAAELPPLDELVPEMPASTARVLTRMVRKDPAERYRDAEAALRDLPGEAGGAGDAPEDPHPTRELPVARRSRPRWLVPAVAVGALLLAAVVALLLLPARSARITLTSEPPGAGVFFAGERVATTPAEGLLVRVGTTLDVRLPGHTAAAVALESPEQRALHAVLEPERIAVEIASRPPGAELLLAGEAAGTTPLELEVQPGTEARLRLPGYEERTLELPRETGRLEVTLTPRAVEPHGLTSGAALAAELERLATPDGPVELRPLGLRNDGTVAIGEEISFLVASRRPLQLALFVLAPDGSLTCLYPSPRRPRLEIGAGESLELPLASDRAAGFRLRGAPPPGRDRVYLLAAAEPLAPPLPAAGPDAWWTDLPSAGAAPAPAARFVAWVGEVRRRAPADSFLVGLGLDVVERGEGDR